MVGVEKRTIEELKDDDDDYSFEDFDEPPTKIKLQDRRSEKTKNIFNFRKQTEYNNYEDDNEDHMEETEVKEKDDAKNNTNAVPRKTKRPARSGNTEEQVMDARAIRETQQAQNEKFSMTEEQGSVDDVVANAYNKQTHFSQKQARGTSDIYRLRLFNNLVKRMLILKYGKGCKTVLELACGKGGDLQKWAECRINHYVGVDISRDAIHEAVNRYRSMNAFDAIFKVSDAFGSDIDETLPEYFDRRFDIVSCQFALHYAFETERKARITLLNISKKLNMGGYFIGTLPSSSYIKYHLSKFPKGCKGFGNSIFSLQFDEVPPRDGKFASPYGNKYYFYLKDAINYIPEFFVDFDDLRQLADEYGLEVCLQEEIFKFYGDEIQNLYEGISTKIIKSLTRKSDGKVGLEGEEKSAAMIYLVFAFKKVA